MKRQRLTSRIAADSSGKAKSRTEQRKGELSRNLDGFDYDKSKAKVLKRALHNINVSLGTLLAAAKDLSLLRGSEITPDGMPGGRGFIMAFRDMKRNLNEAIGSLSDVTDTLADELTNPNWGLSSKERTEVKKEKEEINDTVEEIEETVPETPENPDQAPPEAAPPETEQESEEDQYNQEPMPDSGDTPISNADVVDSSEIESIKRYRDLIEGNVKDRVASVLSKQITANIVKGA